MRLTMAERRVLIKSFAPRYRKKGKKVKGEVLTEFTQMTGYNRCYGAYLLRHQGKRVWLSPKRVVFNVNYFFPWTTIKIPVSPGERM